MNYLIVFASLLSFPVFSACIQLDPATVQVKWTAYKTPAKAGVGGSFKTVTISPAKGESLEKLATGQNFSIDASSVFTNNEARDAKIVKFFFSTMKNGAVISGNIKEVVTKKNQMILALTLNGQTKEVPLTYTFEGNKLEAQGAIDVFDFVLNDQLAEINKACYALHEGKTWNDVGIALSAQFSSCK